MRHIGTFLVTLLTVLLSLPVSVLRYDDGMMLCNVELKAGEAFYVGSLPQSECLIAGCKVMIL